MSPWPELLQAVRERLAARHRIPPDKLEFLGIWEDTGLALFNVTEPGHPHYRSTVSEKIVEV